MSNGAVLAFCSPHAKVPFGQPALWSAPSDRPESAPSCRFTASQPVRPTALNFGPAPGTDFFPNPPTAYLQTPNECFHANEVIVVRGKA